MDSHKEATGEGSAQANQRAPQVKVTAQHRPQRPSTFKGGVSSSTVAPLPQMQQKCAFLLPLMEEFADVKPGGFNLLTVSSLSSLEGNNLGKFKVKAVMQF